nr:hypothetical protein [bacterium]
MSINPFEQNPCSTDLMFMDWDELYPKSYNKNDTDAFTKTRIILMNGTEFEANGFSHQFARHCPNNDVRRELAMTRRQEQQQQKKLSHLKPINENLLEHTISYEQLAVDLTAILAQREPNPYVKMALDFALLEDFDHLYRYADLLEMEHGVRAEKLVGCYTEIMPARPTIAEHRCPRDAVNRFTGKNAALITKLNTNIITAAEQQTMNYYMNVGAFYTSPLGRKLYQEIAMIEEQHVSEYESLIDPTQTWFENLLMHEYVEAYLYYSCYEDECDPYIRHIWEQFFMMEVGHLHRAAQLLERYEHKHWQQVIPGGAFPELLKFHPNKEYVRDVIRNTVWLTKDREDYTPVCDLPADADFFTYQGEVNPTPEMVPSHQVICQYIRCRGMDYRFEVAPNPIVELRNRRCDNTEVGRNPDCRG